MLGMSASVQREVETPAHDAVAEAEAVVAKLEEQRRVVAQQYRQIGEHLNQVQGQEHQIGQQLEQVTRQITQAQQSRDGRGWLAKMLKPNEGSEQIEQWSKQQAGLERERAQVSQQREGLERDRAQVSQQYQGIDGQYQRAQLYRDGVKAEQIAERASKNDLDGLGPYRPHPEHGLNAGQQFGMNRGHSNDYGMGL